jgi:hypothetical protein
VPSVSHSVHAGATLAECWDTFLDPAGWPAWVDGFDSVVEVGEDWPGEGSVLRWRSIPAGRGEVRERVVHHDHRRRHRVEFADPAMRGELETTFAIEGEGTLVSQHLEYRLSGAGPVTRLASLLFVKAQVRASLERSLAAFKREAEERAQPVP